MTKLFLSALFVFALTACTKKQNTDEQLLSSVQGQWTQSKLDCSSTWPDAPQDNSSPAQKRLNTWTVEADKAYLVTYGKNCETKITMNLKTESNHLFWTGAHIESNTCPDAKPPLGDLEFSVTRQDRYLKLSSLTRNLGCGVLLQVK